MNDPFDLDEPVGPPAPPPPPYAPPAAPAYPPPPSVQLMGPPRGDLQHAGFRCPSCGYDLTGAVIGGHCPECGSHIDPHAIGSAVTNGMAVTSMVLGILSLALCIFYGIPTIILAPMGIIFGHIARNQIRSGRYSPGSAGFALTGLICSYIGLGLIVVVVLVITLAIML